MRGILAEFYQRSMHRMYTLARHLVSLRRGPKKVLLASCDFVALAILLWAVISVRYGEIYNPSGLAPAILLFLAPSLAVAAIGYRRMYHEITRYFSPRGYSMLGSAVAVASVAWCALVFLAGQVGIPRSSAVVYMVAAPVLVVLMRQAASRILHWAGITVRNPMQHVQKKTTVVLGSGQAAVRFLGSDLSRQNTIVALFDGEPSQVGRSIQGVRVQHWDRLERVIDREQVAEAVVTVKDPSDGPVVDALKILRARGVQCRVYNEVALSQSATRKRAMLREFELRDALPRNTVPPDKARLRETFRGSRIMITGAGGSIGSELVAQILGFQPELVVLFDNSEVALHRITLKSQDLLALSGATTLIKPVLASVTDEHRIDDVLSACKIDTIFHAAAVKHVPLLETEPEAAVVTNVIGTRVVANLAGQHNVRRFVLVSTDKAVRPVSVMGATKRAAELVVAEASDRFSKTIFSSVRFGNVLGSSGSVVERFTDQIQAGGPVTVTHPEMTRYFMTVEEAASLVMEAGALAKGGETFILDMGRPHLILDLAKTMIGLMGYTVRSEELPDGDIEIKFTGIRPGEKLTEDLMVDSSLAMGTLHPKITMLPRDQVSRSRLQIGINRLVRAIEDRQEAEIISLLHALVADQTQSSKLIDLDAPASSTYVH